MNFPEGAGGASDGEAGHDAASVCRRLCGGQWCCSNRHFEPPPLCRHEISAIQRAVGRSDFFETRNGHHFLKVREDGYCLFFDPRVRGCAIYADRPFDCRIFPFDFYALTEKKGWWLLWDCPWGRRLAASGVEPMLARIERTFHRSVIETWAYGNGGYAGKLRRSEGRRPPRLSPAVSFRLLRRVRISPPRAAPGGNRSQHE